MEEETRADQTTSAQQKIGDHLEKGERDAPGEEENPPLTLLTAVERDSTEGLGVDLSILGHRKKDEV